VWQTATHRARLGQLARVDAALYVDECQNFLNLPRSFDEMLAEARGYGLSMVLAHQHLAQLPRDLREAVSANARTKVFFSMSPEDAHALSRHVAPELTEHDLSHLGAFQAAARLVVAGEETPAFTLRTRPSATGSDRRLDQVRRAAQAKGRAVVDAAGSPLAFEVVPGERERGTVCDPQSAGTSAVEEESMGQRRPKTAPSEPADTGMGSRGVVSGDQLSSAPGSVTEGAGHPPADPYSETADLRGKR
jgi:hypothetical protein